MDKKEKAYKKKLDRNEAFIEFLGRAEGDFDRMEFRNSSLYKGKDSYTLNFNVIGKIHKDYPLSASLFFGNKAIAVYNEDGQIHLPSERGASLDFKQRPNSMISITLCYPYVDVNSPFSGLDLGIVRPHRLLKKSYQKRLFHVLITSMENYSFSGNPSCFDKIRMLWYKEIYAQIKEDRVYESRWKSHLWAVIKWTVCAIVGGYIAGHEASKFPTTIKDSQFERYDSIMVQSKEEISSVKQEMLNKTNELNIQLDSIQQTVRENGEAIFKEIRIIKDQVSTK